MNTTFETVFKDDTIRVPIQAFRHILLLFRKRPKVDRSKKSGDFQLGGQGLDLFGGQPFDRG